MNTTFAHLGLPVVNVGTQSRFCVRGKVTLTPTPTPTLALALALALALTPSPNEVHKFDGAAHSIHNTAQPEFMSALLAVIAAAAKAAAATTTDSA